MQESASIEEVKRLTKLRVFSVLLIVALVAFILAADAVFDPLGMSDGGGLF